MKTKKYTDIDLGSSFEFEYLFGDKIKTKKDIKKKGKKYIRYTFK